MTMGDHRQVRMAMWADAPEPEEVIDEVVILSTANGDQGSEDIPF